MDLSCLAEQPWRKLLSAELKKARADADYDIRPAIHSFVVKIWVDAYQLDAVIGDGTTYQILRSYGYSLPEDIGFASRRLDRS